jgi:hypothetical protein
MAAAVTTPGTTGTQVTEAILQRVRKLLERAGHEGTPEEEARTAGVIAARLIYRYQISIGNEIAAHSASGPASSPSPPRTAPSSVPNPAYSRDTSWVPRRSVRILSRYPGWCQCCYGEYFEEHYIAWVKGEGATHWDCRDYWDNGIHTTREGFPWPNNR